MPSRHPPIRWLPHLVTSALIVLTLAFCQAASAAERPNLVVILADDLGYSDLGCYGGEIETPNLDKLAAGGLRFTQFYNTARCWPTRASIMTGYYPQQVGQDPARGRFPVWTRTLPQMLKPLGYRSYHSGKWHVQNAPRVVADGGFDRSYHLQDHNNHFTPRRHEEDDRPLPPAQAGAGYYTSTAIADHAIRCLKEHADQHKGRPFFSYVAFTAPHFPIQAPAEDVAKYRERYRKGWDTLRADRYERMKKMGLIDCPLSKPEPQIVAPSGKESDLEILGPGELRHAAAWDQLTAEQKEFQATKLAIHAAMIDRMDREIGRLLGQVRAMNAMEDTLVLFLADNGASAEVMVRGDGHDRSADPGSAATFLCLGPGGSTVGNTPFRRHKIWVHEGGIATPLVVHWPKGIAARGELRHDPGHVVDLVPTLLQAAGGGAAPTSPVDTSAAGGAAESSGTAAPNAPAAPATGPSTRPVTTKAPPFPGRSLVPAFGRDRAVTHDYLFWNHSGNRALRVGDWKLVSAATDNNRWELYDLKTDRAESNDLSAAQPQRLNEMVARWEQLQAEFTKQADEGTPPGGPATRQGKGKGKAKGKAPPAAEKAK